MSGSDSKASARQMASRTEVLQFQADAGTGKLTPGFQAADSRIAPMTPASSGSWGRPRRRTFVSGVGSELRRAVSRRCTMMSMRQEDGQHHAADEQRLAPECGGRPEEIDAAQEADEQRRVAERRQRAADVGDQEDEEDDDMGVEGLSSLARMIGRIRIIEAPVVPMTEASIAPSRSSAGIDQRRAVDVAGNQDAARNREEREQQDDEGHVFGEQRVQHRLGRRLGMPKANASGTITSAAQSAAILP